jgi:hypothetical protein
MSSTITIINNTDETLRIGIFRKPIKSPTLETIAWQVVNPPIHGESIILLPSSYSVYAEYPTDPTNPNSVLNKTATIDFDTTTANFIITSETDQDGHVVSANIVQSFSNLENEEIQVENHFDKTVSAHIQQDGYDLYPAHNILPENLFAEDIRGGLYLAIVNELIENGGNVIEEEISQTSTPILEGQTATATGSKSKGYQIVIS